MAIETSSVGLCAGAAASSQSPAHAQAKNPTVSEVAIHVFKKYVYNPAVIAAYPAILPFYEIKYAFNFSFRNPQEGAKNHTAYSRHYLNSNNKEFNFLSWLRDKIHEVISYEVNDSSNYLFQALEKTAFIVFQLTEIIAQAVHKIFNYVLPNYLNPSHLISFAGTFSACMVRLPVSFVDDFEGFKEAFLYTGTLNQASVEMTECSQPLLNFP